ncbi:MAG: PLP-dependent transferase [Chloroflexi bacterium]|nr:PLP-dependent transferase [Chloroflexota bacterium]
MNPTPKFKHLETLAIHAGHHIDPSSGAVMAPINLSTTFERKADGSYTDENVYSRSNNPNRRALEECLAALEGGATAAAFASGMAATMSLFQALKTGDHVVGPDDVYFGTGRLAQELFGVWGLDYTIVDMTDLDQVRQALRPNTQVVWVETPSNPLLKITDIAAVSSLAHQVGARCVVDNTWPSPVCQQPLLQGADIVMHSTTKYLGGHSDLVGGALIARQNDLFFQRIRMIQQLGGAVPSPFDCWLLRRSITTLPYRMRGHCENALKVARFLATQPGVTAVHYPGLESHPGFAIAQKQMSSFGGMLSIQVPGGASDALAVANQVKLFTQATSLGGVESLIEHRYSVEGPTSRTPANLLRLSIGLENAEDLIADLAQALSH